jgi:hypothetical protein
MRDTQQPDRTVPRPVYIHAGAHRTGTSSFQMCLDRNARALARAGFDALYPGRDGIPGGRLRLRLPGPRHGPAKMPGFVEAARDGLAAVPDRGRPLILSEENIPGRMFHFYQGQFYPAAAARLETLARALADRPAHLVYVLRPYGELYVSAYRKRAEDNAVGPFDRIVPYLLEMDRGWPELLADMRDILDPRQMTVLPYAKRAQSRDLLRLLVPDLAGVELTEPEATLNLSATDTALDILQRRYHAGEELGREDWAAIIGENHGNRRDTGFSHLTPDEAGELEALYERDLARIAQMPGITLI